MARALERSTRRRNKGTRASSRYGLTPREWRAVQRVRKRLHALLPNDEIKSLILYGSKVRGEARLDSDVDLFLVYDRVTPAQEKSLEELPIAASDEFPGLHLFTYRAEDVVRYNGVSPLLYNVARQGIALEGVPVPKLEINRRQVAEDGIALAKEELASAQHSLNGNFYRSTISQSYYAVLYAADAALATKGLVPKSHEGTKSLFGYHFIRKGLVDAKFKGLVNGAKGVRMKADYDRKAKFTRGDAEHWFERAKEFVTAIESAIPGWLAEESTR